jgi:sugar phosphate isomerase/epimerase
MQWSFATIVLVPRGEWGPKPGPDVCGRTFDWAARAGFSGVELSPRWLDFHASTSSELRALRRHLADAGLVASGLNISRCILTRTPEAPSHWSRLTRSVEVAEILGAEILNLSLSMPTLPGPHRPLLHGRDVPEGEFQRSAELVEGLARRARDVGVRISVELHDDGLLDSAELCLRFLSMIAAANVGVNPDLGNICRAEPLPEWEHALRLLVPRTNCWHVKNYRQGEGTPLWDGDIDYDRAFAIMKESGYKGWVAIESYFGNVLDLQRRSLEYLKRLAAPTAS